MQAAEEDADVKPICLIRQVECGGIQAGIGPAIVGGKLSKLVDGHAYASSVEARSRQKSWYEAGCPFFGKSLLLDGISRHRHVLALTLSDGARKTRSSNLPCRSPMFLCRGGGRKSHPRRCKPAGLW